MVDIEHDLLEDAAMVYLLQFVFCRLDRCSCRVLVQQGALRISSKDACKAALIPAETLSCPS